MPETQIGKVTHYFGNIGVAIVKLAGTLVVGDTVHVKGASSGFEQKVESMQVEHESVSEGKAGEEVGIKVSGKVREGDAVYKVE